jgi:hypothetical protein
MPILRVMKNGKHLCTIGSEDVWAFSASLYMDVWGPAASSLDISGGSKRRPGGESDFLIWEMSHEISKQDKLSFSFEAGTASSPKGIRFNPDAPPQESAKMEMSFPPTDNELTDLESHPAHNNEIAWTFSVNGAPGIKTQPDTTRQNLTLHMIWNEDKHPEKLTVILAKKSVREIMNDSEGEVIFEDATPVGSTFDIIVSA